MKELVFLPDREGRDELPAQSGFVRVGNDGAALKSLSDRLVLPPEEEKQTDTAMWRGVLALALLCDAWPDSGVSVKTLTVEGSTSLFATWVLNARPAAQRGEALHLVLLEKDGARRLLGIADAHAGLVLPATKTDFKGFVPERARWYDGENDSWHDPVPCLNEHERAILLARITMMGLDTPEVTQLKVDLAGVDKAAAEAVQSGEESSLTALGLRIQAVCALQDFADFSMRREPCLVEKDNALVRLFSAVDVRYSAARECATYLWKGAAFARTSAALGLTGFDDPEQAAALADIEGELLLLKDNSTRWNARCAANVADWLDHQDAALLPEVRAQAELICHVQRQKACEIRTTVTLQWPWDASSGAVRYLLEEALGDGWMEAAKNPFADYLTRLTGYVLGDGVLQRNCACEEGVFLPPLSQEMALCIARCGDGEGLAQDMMRFEAQEDGSVAASFLLRGLGEVRMCRVYQPEEIMTLTQEESPCIALWPSLPMAHWHAYHVFVRGGETAVAALSGGNWETLAPEENAEVTGRQSWRCLRVDAFPSCLCLMKEHWCLGVLPNAQPLYRVEITGEAQISIDLGSSSTAVALQMDGKPVAYKSEPLTRVLLQPREMAEDSFLGSLTLGELTPSAVLLTGDGDTLFRDGYAYAVTHLAALDQLAPGSVCTQLKWRADARSVRARRILLHQVMLSASLQAVLAGAKNVRWRLTVADEMADEGRDVLLNLASELSVEVAEETGLLLKDGKFFVTWAEEAAALHAYLRAEGGMKGTFAVLDLGGSSTKLHLWMQGKARPLGGAVVMEGASTVLLHALQEHPERLWEDFEDCGNDELLDAVSAVCEQLSHAEESAAQSDKALMLLDALLEDYKQPITQQLYSRFTNQNPTWLQSILLEMYASALFSVGLMLEQAGNDGNISHLFPADLTVCMTGRGAWLLDTLTPQLRNGLQHIAHGPVNLRHPVSTITVRAVPLSAMAVAWGMAVLRDTQNTIDTPVIRTRQSFSELMLMLTGLLFQCYPQHMWKLHPGVYDQWGRLMPAGDNAVRRAASAVYGDGEDIPAAVMAFTAGLRQAEMMPENIVYPGE